MSEEYGNDLITIADEEGNEFELECLGSIELDNQVYGVFLPAEMDENDDDYGIILLKVIEEGGEELYASIDDDDELDRVYEYYMQQLFDESLDDEEE